MCAGLAVPADSFAPEQIARLRGRVYPSPDGGGEVRFLWRQLPRWLPVLHEGRLRVVRWGCSREESRSLPPTGWTWLATVEMGGWSGFDPEEVIVPARRGWEKGVWFPITHGIRALLVNDEKERPHAYLICEKPSRYYDVMTRFSGRMPCLVRQRIE